MKGTWKRWLVGSILTLVLGYWILLWQTQVLIRLPFRAAHIMFPDSRLKVTLNGHAVPSVTVYRSSLPDSSWSDLLLLDFPEQKPGDPKIMVIPERMSVGDCTGGPDRFQRIGPWLARADFALVRNLYGVKGYEGEPHFVKSSNYLRFRLPRDYKAYPDATIEIRCAESATSAPARQQK